MTHEHGCKRLPKRVAELGPGDFLGVGLAALLTGSEEYFAFDVVEHADIETNLNVFDVLVELFHKRQNIPDGHEFPDIHPALGCYDFPNYILSEELLDRTLTSRVEQIRYSIEHQNAHDSLIHYAPTWTEAAVIQTGTVDMILSQAVLEMWMTLRAPMRRCSNGWWLVA